ncbi:MAG: LamB/YcsF family protein [Alphaproteobacteria bacterium]|nr:LamB/YcsF family protein [Alphaproteobacteria bacterium]
MGVVVDLNSDMGESFGVYKLGDDAAMLRIVSSANVACGFHAGDPLVMHATVGTAKANGVAVGAHPSFRDLWGFGRRQIVGENPEDVGKEVVYQIGALQAIARAVGHRMSHVKTHGSLGNLIAVDEALADGVAGAIRGAAPDAIFVVMPGTAMERAGQRHNLRMAREIYADRTYQDDGTLTSRKQPGSVLHDPEAAAARVLQMVRERAIVSVSGKRVPVAIDTICVHGDSPDAVAMARRVREVLEADGVRIRPMAEVIG